MIYDLTKNSDVEKLKSDLNFLYTEKKIVEVSVYSPPRSISFNAYFHLVLSVFAVEYGESLEYVKMEIFKKYVNRDIFVINVFDGEKMKEELLSTKDLTSKELFDCLERFKNFCAKELGWWFPEFDNDVVISQMESYIKENKKWL